MYNALIKMPLGGVTRMTSMRAVGDAASREKKERDEN